MAGGTDEAPKRTFGCALATRSKRSGVSALKLRSGYWTETVNPLNRFWRELTAFVQNRAFPIDNNAAERAVRSMTTACNNSFHFGSAHGAQMSATYHSIFFTKIFEGSRDYSSL